MALCLGAAGFSLLKAPANRRGGAAGAAEDLSLSSSMPRRKARTTKSDLAATSKTVLMLTILRWC